MLNNVEFDDWCKHLQLSNETRAIIENIRRSPPARRVRSGRQNVKVHFNRSTKMNHTIQAESSSVEFAALLIMEFPSSVFGLQGDDVLEIWDQPPSFLINYRSNKG